MPEWLFVYRGFVMAAAVRGVDIGKDLREFKEFTGEFPPEVCGMLHVLCCTGGQMLT
jgi:hypothetical protein